MIQLVDTQITGLKKLHLEGRISAGADGEELLMFRELTKLGLARVALTEDKGSLGRFWIFRITSSGVQYIRSLE